MLTALVLAAGESRRMGEVNKLLLPYGDVPLIEHVVRTVVQSEVDEVVVVLGHEADRVRAALAAYEVLFGVNDRYREGMTTSIQAGVRAASPEADGFMICLSDLPLIVPEDLNRLRTAFEQAVREGAPPIVVPIFNGRRGNPVIFSAAYKSAILAHREWTGCKQIVQQNRAHVLEVTMLTDHVLRDIDTMDAYHRLQKHRPA